MKFLLVAMLLAVVFVTFHSSGDVVRILDRGSGDIVSGHERSHVRYRRNGDRVERFRGRVRTRDASCDLDAGCDGQ